MQNHLEFKNVTDGPTYQPTYRPTQQGVESCVRDLQGLIHDNPVADSLAGAVMQKPLAILEIFRPTDKQTDRHSNL